MNYKDIFDMLSRDLCLCCCCERAGQIGESGALRREG
jgi:hypothetical protein